MNYVLLQESYLYPTQTISHIFYIDFAQNAENFKLNSEFEL